MYIADMKTDVTITWEGGGVTAPLDMWVEQMLIAMPEDQQKKVLDAVIAEVKRRNETHDKEHRTLFDGEGVA